jgi:Ca2+-binding RTX toxin-like protein
MPWEEVMKANFVSGIVAILISVLVPWGASADDCANDMPAPYDTAGCDPMTSGNTCEYNAGKVECYGTDTKDVMHIISSNNDPIAYGVLDVGGGNYRFCCDVNEMDNDTWPLYIELYDGDDELCLHDAGTGWCANVLGANPWPANTTILAGGDDDRITTAYNGGAYVDTVELGNGDDVAYTWAGADDVLGESGDDEIYLGAGNDKADGGTGSDSLYGNDNDDTLIAGTGGTQASPDYMIGGANTDCVCGGTNIAGGTNDSGYDVLNAETCYYWVAGSLDNVNACGTATPGDCGC